MQQGTEVTAMATMTILGGICYRVREDKQAHRGRLGGDVVAHSGKFVV